jgi:2-iminobutanoate/2-iminopropanoate deaminase
MKLTPIDPETTPIANGGYTNALLVENAQRLLFISGQIPESRDGEVPSAIEDQCRLAWRNILAVLADTGLGVSNLVKVTTFLSDRADSAANTAVRCEVLGDHRPALSVIITGIWDPAWLIEIEAIAAA